MEDQCSVLFKSKIHKINFYFHPESQSNKSVIKNRILCHNKSTLNTVFIKDPIIKKEKIHHFPKKNPVLNTVLGIWRVDLAKRKDLMIETYISMLKLSLKN